MSKFFYSVIILLVLFFGFTFAYMNNQPVVVAYLSYRLETSLALLLLLTLLLGVVCGFAVSLVSSFRVRRELSRARRDLRNLDSKSI